MLNTAAGLRGMVTGQYLDVQATDSDMIPGQIEYMYQFKTGTLISASLVLGDIAVGATQQQLKALSSFGNYIGLAFQVVDDILDEEGDMEKMDKPGARAAKPTNPRTSCLWD